MDDVCPSNILNKTVVIVSDNGESGLGIPEHEQPAPN